MDGKITFSKMVAKYKVFCYNAGMTKHSSAGRKIAAYPLQRLTIQATDEEIAQIKERLSTRQRAEILLHAAINIDPKLERRKTMTLYYERDIRSHTPNIDNHRWGRFKAGWKAFVSEKHFDPAVLTDRLTYNNIGYRMAATHNAAFTADEDEQLVRQAYDLAVAIQASNLKIRDGKAPGNLPKNLLEAV